MAHGEPVDRGGGPVEFIQLLGCEDAGERVLDVCVEDDEARGDADASAENAQLGDDALSDGYKGGGG